MTNANRPGDNHLATRDYFWLNLRELPYFRALIRAVEAAYYQDYPLEEPTLDVGCGDGHFARITFEKPIQVGIDPWWAPLHKEIGRAHV